MPIADLRRRITRRRLAPDGETSAMAHARTLRRSAQTKVSAARIYDFLLGGSHNFREDRAAARALLHAVPSAQVDAWANRSYLRRSLGHLLDHGVRQFLDLGSGLPTVGNVHEIAQNVHPAARVVYVDSDPVVVAHAQRQLAGTEHTAVLEADLRDVTTVLDSPEIRGLLDFSHPIGLLAAAVLHFIPDHDNPAEVLNAYREALAPGSYLVVSHATPHALSDFQIAGATAVYADTGTPLTLRTPAEIAKLFTGYHLIPAGEDGPAAVTRVTDWRPDPLEHAIPTRTIYGGVGLLPGSGAEAIRRAAPQLPARR